MRVLLAAGLISLGSLVAAPTFAAPSTQPAGSSTAALQLRANESFNRGEFAAALPILQKVAGQMKGDPSQADQLAMVQEQIRVCQRNLTSLPPLPPAAPAMMASSINPPPTIVASASNPPAAAAASSAVTSIGDTSALTGNTGPNIPMGADRIPHPHPKPGEVLEMSIKELGNFEFDPDHPTPLPTDVVSLNGSTIRLRGYMIPMDQAESITQFALVPSLFSCCFGQPPQIQHTIVVDCPKGKAVSYYPDEIIVQGKLDVQEKKDDGFIVSLFEVSASSVKPAPK